MGYQMSPPGHHTAIPPASTTIAASSVGKKTVKKGPGDGAAVSGHDSVVAVEAKDDIADVVRSQLSDVMEEFGYTIVKALVTDIEPAAEVKESMNRINAAERLKVAAELEAEADKIRMVKAAEAEAESKHLQGLGIARQRKAIADGLAESAGLVQNNMESMSAETVMALLLLTQYFDTLQSMAEKSGSRTIFLPHSPGGMADIYTPDWDRERRQPLRPGGGSARCRPRSATGPSAPMISTS